jgi:hypothetical protein
MTAIEGLEVLIVSLCTVLIALGLAASALKLVLTGLLEREWRAADD